MTLYGYKCFSRNKIIPSKNALNKNFYTFSNVINNDSICYFTNNPFLLFQTFPTCTECIGNERFIKLWVPFFICGIVCLFGNGIVIFRQINSFFKQSKKNKETQIFNLLILSLSLADILMGIYLVAISFELKTKSYDGNIYFTEYRFCNALGIISFISSQVSLSTIVLISLYRLYGVICPYKQANWKKTVLLILLIWTLWILLALLPLSKIELLRTNFDYGIRKNELGINNSTVFYIDYFTIVKNFDKIKELLPNSYFREIINMITSNNSSINILQKAMQSFNILDYDLSTWSPVGYYNIHFYCSMSLIIHKSNFIESNAFTLLVVVCNLISCIVAIAAYTCTYFSVADCRFKLMGFVQKMKQSDKASVNNSKLRNSENRKIFFTITIIVLTDVIFWFGMCLVSLVYWERYSVKSRIELNNFLNIYAQFQSIMFCLIPINSIFNPFIYLHRFWYSLFKKLKMLIL